MNVGIYIYELAEELDWAAAWSDRNDDVHVFTITDTDARYIQYDPEPPV